MTDAWTHTLDECEARLDTASAALDAGGSPQIPSFPARGPAEPFPAELVDRALALVKRSVELERRLGVERDRVRTELRRLPRMPRVHVESHFEVKA